MALGATPIAAAAQAIGIEPQWLRVERVCLSANPKYRFVQISDVHHKGDRAYLMRVVDQINQEKPDFVCFTGDLVEDASFAAEALELLQKINSPLYGIAGNHDYWAEMDFDLARDCFSATGGAWLTDEEIAIQNDKVQLFGMSGFKPFTPVSGRKNILLTHYPDAVHRFPNTKFDLVIAGHSHGGQVRLPGYGAVILPSGVGEYQLGMYQTPAGPLYVNAGIGYFYANVRLFCRPEITVFEV